ncbi:MAG: helix-turn-helix transcriptional regulator [Myxococcota bacterium]
MSRRRSRSRARSPRSRRVWSFRASGYASLGRTAGLSPHHLHRAFRAVCGESLHRYLTRLRLERAARLLRTTDRSVTEICSAVGYQSLGSFSTLFRREHGCSPAAWRRDAREIPTIREAPGRPGAVGSVA